MTLLIAHRGHSATAPENTMAAFQAAVDAGFPWVETDADMLADGTLVLIHDATFKRTAGSPAKVSASTADDVARLDAGSWFGREFADERVPHLSELVDLMNGTGLSTNLELKLSDPTEERIAGFVRGLVRELGRLDASPDDERVIISSFDQRVLQAFHRAAPQYAIACLYKRRRFAPPFRPSAWKRAARAVDATYVHPHHGDLSRAAIRRIHRAGFKVNTWTVNDAARAALLRNWGADGICTDGPEGLKPVDFAPGDCIPQA